MRPHEKQLKYYWDKISPTSILNIALHVHMVYTGAMDYYQDYLKDVSLLQWAINNWDDNEKRRGHEFDKAAKLLIQTALTDFKYFKKELYVDLDISVLDNPEYFMES